MLSFFGPIFAALQSGAKERAKKKKRHAWNAVFFWPHFWPHFFLPY
jgi:hypothetical protein